MGEIKDKMAEQREFYWLNSNFIFNVKVEVYVREEPLNLDDMAIVHDEYAMDRENVYTDVISSGKNLANYGTIFGIRPCDGYTGNTLAGTKAWAGNSLNYLANQPPSTANV